MRRRARRAGWALALILTFSFLAAQPALATFHNMWIREVYPGSSALPDSEYVELQMWESGQHLVAGHTITVLDGTGKVIGSTTFPGNVANGANQSTIVAATAAAEAQFGFTADVALTPALINPTGGAVCWESLDCVSWGAFSGTTNSPSGPPAAAIPDGQALRRSISRTCASLLEASDDRDSSAGDFEAVFPKPRPNSVPPSERPCGPSGGGGGGGGGATDDDGAPRTTLKAKPAKRTADRTPSFRFSSNESDATFQCKLDGKPYRGCGSPFTSKRLSLGAHVFRVRARHHGILDASPATFRFSVVLRPSGR